MASTEFDMLSPNPFDHKSVGTRTDGAVFLSQILAVR